MAKDPYKYFRIEARELLEAMSQGVLALEKDTSAVDLVPRLLREAHTLKGAARVVKQNEIADLAHSLEDILAVSPGRALGRDDINALLRLLDAMTQQLATLLGEAPPMTPAPPRSAVAPAAPAPTPGVPPLAPAAPVAVPERRSAAFETARVEIGEMDSLLAHVAEANVQVEAIRQAGQALVRARRMAETLTAGMRDAKSHASTQDLHTAEMLREALVNAAHAIPDHIERLSSDLAQLSSQANRLRLVAASTMFGPLERAVRDAAQLLDKDVDFTATGGDTHLDGHVLSGVRDALLHVVRNAVAHGIEASAERRAANKPVPGKVNVAVERRGHRIVVTCTDDGRGIDVDALKRVAVARGLVDSQAAQTLGTADGMRLIFSPGITTARALTEVAGRGVGLDAVRASIANIKGDIDVESSPGHGTTITVTVPLSLSSVTALLCDGGGFVNLLPLVSVRRIVRVRDADIARMADQESVVHEGQVLPFAPLASLLGQPNVSRHPIWSVIIIGAPGGVVALGVQQVLGIADVVVRSIPLIAFATPLIAGACLDSDGNPRPMLDPQGLVDAVRARSHRTQSVTEKVRLPILVVDDSLTTRMLEQSILESAGYQVDLATSAEEALEKAKTGHYALFIVDVEMPGMNGFEFVAKTRADAVLSRTPAILVTSLSLPEHRRRGQEVGAHAYIVKGEFHQEHFLKTVHGLMN